MDLLPSGSRHRKQGLFFLIVLFCFGAEVRNAIVDGTVGGYLAYLDWLTQHYGVTSDRKLKDRRLTVGLVLGDRLRFTRRRFLGRWLLSMARTAEFLHRYRTQSHIVPEIRKLDQQGYIASSRKAPTGCPAQQQSNFRRPRLHLDCISSRAPPCSLQDYVQQLAASLIDQLVIQTLSNIRPQPQVPPHQPSAVRASERHAAPEPG